MNYFPRSREMIQQRTKNRKIEKKTLCFTEPAVESENRTEPQLDYTHPPGQNPRVAAKEAGAISGATLQMARG